MAYLVACPVCGCQNLVPDGLEIALVGCTGCGHRFPPRREDSAADGQEKQPRRTKKEKKPPWRPAGVLPFCPRCQRQVGWDDPTCRYCGEEFEEESDRPDRWLGRKPGRTRRDVQPHRGKLLAHLANITLALSW